MTGSNVNVRASASTSGRKLGSMSRNETVEIISSSNGFYKIVYKGGIGYVSADYVRVTGQGCQTATPTTTPTQSTGSSGSTGEGTLLFISSSEAKLAATPGGGMVNALLSKGSVVTLISESGDYYYVKASNGSTGYISKYEASATPDKNVNPEYLLPAGTLYIKVDDTPIRSSLDSSVYYGSLAIGTAITVEKTDGAFSYISASGGTKGWITTESIGTAKGIANQPTPTPDAGSSGTGSSGSSDSSTSVRAKIKLSSSSSYLNMRDEPSTSGDVVAQLQNTDTVYVLASNGDWYKINFSGKTGYVMKKYVNLVGGDESDDDTSSGSSSSGSASSGTTGTIRLSSAASTVNVRSGAGTNKSKLGTLSHGATVKVIASNGDWYKIEYGTGYGYVLKSYVRLSSSSSSGSSSSSSSQGTATTTTALTLRSTGSTSGDKLGVYAAGTKVTVLDKGSTWSKVKVDGKTGYMKNSYLKFN